MKKQIITLILLVTAFGLGGLFLTMEGNDAVSAATEKKDSLLVADQVSVSFQQIGGKIVSVSVQEGQVVKKGAVLMQLDSTDTDLLIEKTNAQIDAMDIQISQAEKSAGDQEVVRQQKAVDLAKEILDYTKKNYDRTKGIYDEGACSQSTLDDAQLKLTTAQNSLAQNQELLEKYQSNYENAKLNVPSLQEQKEALQIQLKTYEEQKSRMTLKAPTDGTIIKIICKEGENVSSGTPVILLQSAGLYFDLYVPEIEVNEYQVGMSIPVDVIALNKIWSGKVHLINSAPQYTSMRMSRDNGQGDLSVFQVRIYLEGDLQKLLPGMTVEVKNAAD